MRSGSVKCWGRNDVGQLGDGTNVNSLSPVEVKGLEHDAVDIAAGENYTCVLTASGGVKCWGLNSFGQLGVKIDESCTREDGYPVYCSLEAVQTEGLVDGFVALAAGGTHSCALNEDGVLFCWGLNNFRKLGYESNDECREMSSESFPCSREPAKVDAFRGKKVKLVSLGCNHSCAVLASGKAFCWGANNNGQLGAETEEKCRRDELYKSAYFFCSSVPVEVSGLEDKIASLVSGCENNCVITESGGVKCWGYDQQDGSEDDYVYCEGSSCSVTPRKINGLDGKVTEISAGDSIICALTENSTVQCWGHGILGDGNANSSSETPKNVENMSRHVVDLETGKSHSCIVLESGHMKCWGENFYGQLGNGVINGDYNTAMLVEGLEQGDIQSIYLSDKVSCAAGNSGPLKCWGDLSKIYPVLTDKYHMTFLPVETDENSEEIAAMSGDENICILTRGGGVKCWNNVEDRFSEEAKDNYEEAFVDVVGLESGVTDIKAKCKFACALTSSGGVKCWGNNYHGQLGSGSNEYSSPEPVDVVGLESGVKELALGCEHACALTKKGSVRCWGDNLDRQLACDHTKYKSCKWSEDNYNTPGCSNVPVKIEGLSGKAVALGAGYASACAISEEGIVDCWGTFKKLEGHTIEDDWAVTPIGESIFDLTESLGGKAVSLSSDGSFHSCAVMRDGRVKCWGSNDSGQAGEERIETCQDPEDKFSCTCKYEYVGGIDGSAVQVLTGIRHTCVLMESGRLKCFGANESAQLGRNPGWRAVDVVGL